MYLNPYLKTKEADFICRHSSYILGISGVSKFGMCSTWQNLNLVWNKAAIDLSSSSQQQSNLIPGLNLNALGIFSSGLPVLPPAAGPRGAVPPVSPAGYNPFLVSALTFCFNKLFLRTTLKKKKRIDRDIENPPFTMASPLLSQFFKPSTVLCSSSQDYFSFDKAICSQQMVH